MAGTEFENRRELWMHSQTHSQTSIVEAGQDLRMSPVWLLKILKPDGGADGRGSPEPPRPLRLQNFSPAPSPNGGMGGGAFRELAVQVDQKSVQANLKCVQKP